MNGCRVRVVSLAKGVPAFVQFDFDTVGHKIDGDYGNYQIVCRGLDGGNFDVALLGPDDVFRNFVVNKTGTDIVIIPDGYHFQAIKVTFNALGVNAAAVATLSAMGRLVRYSS
jgi:hypothetical protein